VLTPSEVSYRLNLGYASTLALIRSGELPAMNVAKTGAKRPVYRVSEADLERYLAPRRTIAPHAAPRSFSRKCLPTRCLDSRLIPRKYTCYRAICCTINTGGAR